MSTLAEIIWEIEYEPCVNRREKRGDWEFCEKIDCRVWHSRNSSKSGYDGDLPEPTVDDVVAWLGGSGYTVRITKLCPKISDGRLIDYHCSVELYETDEAIRDLPYSRKHWGRTAIEALETAARYVEWINRPPSQP